jgi:hypothetical protein
MIVAIMLGLLTLALFASEEGRSQALRCDDPFWYEYDAD